MRNFLKFLQWPSAGLHKMVLVACGLALFAVGVPLAMAMAGNSPSRPLFQVPAEDEQSVLTATATLTETTPTMTGTATATGVVTGTVTSTPAATGTLTAKVTICHRTGSLSNPYVQITVDQNALPAHRAHGDIIPAPPGGCPAALTPLATTTATTTTTITPTPIATGTATTQKVTICHHTGSQKNPYVQITVDQDALPAHQAHGDIIPAPAGGCPAAISPAKSPPNSKTHAGPGNGNGKKPDDGNHDSRPANSGHGGKKP